MKTFVGLDIINDFISYLGFRREVVLHKEGGYAQIYYYTPRGKRLRKSDMKREKICKH